MEPDVDNDGDGLESLPSKLGDVNLTQSSSLNISGGTTAKLGSRVVEGIMSKDVVTSDTRIALYFAMVAETVWVCVIVPDLGQSWDKGTLQTRCKLFNGASNLFRDRLY